MSQVVACCFPGGLLLAADRRVVVEKRGEVKVHSVCKLFSLGTSAAVATSGAAVGISVSRSLSRLLHRRALPPFEELEPYILSVFQKEYDEFVRQGTRWFAEHPDAHRLSYILLGGRHADADFIFRFFASETHGQPYRVLPTGSLLTAPRRLGLEMRLGKAAAARAPAEQVLEVAVEGLRTIAAKDDAVGGPFDLALLDASGVRLSTVEQCSWKT